jgi:hypothetical protein
MSKDRWNVWEVNSAFELQYYNIDSNYNEEDGEETDEA